MEGGGGGGGGSATFLLLYSSVTFSACLSVGKVKFPLLRFSFSLS